VVERLQPVVAASGLPLETAALFDELRTSAATEERARLAKEIHDGIAQDLAYIGFELDGLLSDLRENGQQTAVLHARDLRQRITALISELRTSISHLRSSVAPTHGLGAALSEYARAVGTSSDVMVHLSLAEGPLRLGSQAEVQLLRIAHEAIGSARRRSGVQNLWVTLAVEPPAASLIIEDDGSESNPAAVDPLALEVMLERAEHIRARIDVTHRQPTGIRVCIEVGRGADADSLAG
jgi:signal transduction histidine kinase